MYCEVRFKEKKDRVDMYANGENGGFKITNLNCDSLLANTLTEARKMVEFYGEGTIYDFNGRIRN